MSEGTDRSGRTVRPRAARVVARLDDGMYTHVKIDGRLYRVANVIEALRKQRETLAAKAAEKKEGSKT